MNPQFASAGAATDRPCFTLIARMDKRPPRLVTAEADGEELPSFIRLEDETLVYEIYPEDTPMLVQIKEFMALYEAKGMTPVSVDAIAYVNIEKD